MGSLLRTRRRSASFADMQLGAADGQSWAIDALTDMFLPRLVAFAAARGAADPDGIAHVSLLSVLGRMADLHFEVEQQMWAYLCRTARSRIIDEHRVSKPVELVDDCSALTGAAGERTKPAFVPFDERVVERDYVDGLLSPLTNDQRQVLELRFIEDLSIAETADLTGRSPEAVKGLQRRAINAIIAAAAILLAVLAVRSVGDDAETRRSVDAPADSVEGVDPDRSVADLEGNPDAVEPPVGDAEFGIGDEQGGSVVDGTGDGPSAAAGEVEGPVDAGEDQDGTDGSASPLIAERYPVTVGTERATALDASGQTVPESLHGTRVYCTVSHFAHGDPISAGPATGAPLTLYWGNTAADRSATAAELPDVGNSTCEGGISDRSAYWMPALFDASGQVVLPEQAWVEYKTFGSAGFDRSLINPIPSGLQMLSDPAVANSDRNNGGSGGGAATDLVVRFPECLAVGADGNPILSSPDHTSHLSFAGADTTSGCPASHPYRIPQISYKLTYDVPVTSGWRLSSGHEEGAGLEGLTGGFVAGWDPAAMDLMVRCTVELIDHCEFAEIVDGQAVSRSQLPERFVGADGTAVYLGSGTLTADADRTPFGASIPAIR